MNDIVLNALHLLAAVAATVQDDDWLSRNSTLIVGVVGIVFSGFIGPTVVAVFTGRRERARDARALAVARQDDLRDLLDEAAQVLSGAVGRLRPLLAATLARAAQGAGGLPCGSPRQGHHPQAERVRGWPTVGAHWRLAGPGSLPRPAASVPPEGCHPAVGSDRAAPWPSVSDSVSPPRCLGRVRRPAARTAAWHESTRRAADGRRGRRAAAHPTLDRERLRPARRPAEHQARQAPQVRALRCRRCHRAPTTRTRSKAI